MIKMLKQVFVEEEDLMRIFNINRINSELMIILMEDAVGHENNNKKEYIKVMEYFIEILDLCSNNKKKFKNMKIKETYNCLFLNFGEGEETLMFSLKETPHFFISTVGSKSIFRNLKK